MIKDRTSEKGMRAIADRETSSQQRTADVKRDDKGNVTVRPSGAESTSDASLKRQSDNGQTSQER